MKRLTKRAIDGAIYDGEGGARFVLWDSEIPGFGLRIYPSGKKSFLLSYRVAGRKRLLTLGAYGALTLEQARKLARSNLAEVESGGADPLEQRQKERQGETIKDLCGAYVERYAKAHKKTWKADERRLERQVISRWGNLKAKAIRRSDVAALHTEIGEKQGKRYEANRTVEILSKMFKLARRWGYLDEAAPNPADDIDHYREEKRDRWVTPEELPRLAQAINEEQNQSARNCLWLYLLTGARKSELLRAQWADIDPGRRELRLPETKAGRVHYIPLSGPALALLEQIPRESGNPFLFPGREPGAHLVNIEKAWRRVRKAACVEDVRLHDLRRTVGSWLAQAGNSLHLIGRVLNHSNVSTTAVYARFAQDQVAEALEQHGARIMGAAGLLPSADVVTLPSAKQGKG